MHKSPQREGERKRTIQLLYKSVSVKLFPVQADSRPVGETCKQTASQLVKNTSNTSIRATITWWSLWRKSLHVKTSIQQAFNISTTSYTIWARLLHIAQLTHRWGWSDQINTPRRIRFTPIPDGERLG